MDEDKKNNLIMDETDSSEKQDDNKMKNLFISSDSSNEEKKSPKFKSILKNNSIDENLNVISNGPEKMEATNGMNVFDNDMPDFIDYDNEKDKENEDKLDDDEKKEIKNIESDSETEQSEQSKPDSPKKKNLRVSSMVNVMLKKTTDINGWDHDANETIRNWYHLFRQQSFIYQTVLDYNLKISDRLSIVSIISSGLLGIFSAFKLWVDNDIIFQTVTNIMMIFFNFIVAIITATSKKYIDDKRNDEIRVYINAVDSFLGEISAQVLKSPVYRMNADKFFRQNNDKYTKLITSGPNLSLSEISDGKQRFQKYLAHIEEKLV
jgi:hypothetical protein